MYDLIDRLTFGV